MPQEQLAVTVSDNKPTEQNDKVNVTRMPIATPGEGEVLVRILLRPVNPSDVLSVQGQYEGFQPTEFPAVLGGEGVGVVEKNGPGAGKYKAGQRVVAVPWRQKVGRGTWQEYAVVDEAALLPVPDAVSDEAASQFLINPVTVYGLLDVLHVPQGGYVISTASNSTLGRMFIEYATTQGVHVIGVVRRRAQAEALLKLGAHTVLTQDEDLAARVKEITGGKGAWGAVDAVAGDVTRRVVEAVRPGGTTLVYGFLEGPVAGVGVGDLVFRGSHVTGFWLVLWLQELGEKAPAKLQEVMEALAQGIIKPHSGKKFKLEDAAAAIRHSVTEGREGKTFLES